MAQLYIDEVLSVSSLGPYYLAGLSFGGVVAYEMAQQLTAMGHQIGLLALIDSFPPGALETLPLTQRSMQKLRSWTRRFQWHWREIGAVRAGDWLTYLRRKSRTFRRKVKSRVWQIALQSYAGKENDLPAVFNDVRESNYLAFRNYMARPYPGKVTIFTASENLPSKKHLIRTVWSRVALRGAEMHEVPGDHVTLIEEPHVKVLAEKLRACMDAFRQETPP